MAQVLNVFYLKPVDGGQDSEGQITQNEQVIVEFTEGVNTVKEALKSGPFKIAQIHRFDILDGDIDCSVLGESNNKEWLFNLTYNTISIKSSSQARDDQDYRPEVKPGRWTYSRVVERDKETGEAFLNPAKDPIDPLPIEQISSPLLKITIKEYSANMQRLSSVGSINDAFVRIAGVNCPKYCVMLDDYNSVPYTDEKDILTFMNTFTVKLNFFKNKVTIKRNISLKEFAYCHLYAPPTL